MNWFVRKFRRAFGRCPWCGKKMTSGLTGVFLNGLLICPDRHYAEEVVGFAGTVVYENGGKPLETGQRTS